MYASTIVTEWFKLYIPDYPDNKKLYKHNNKRKNTIYHHSETNKFYYDIAQTYKYRK